ncbi:sugar ABC transporter substrate-binding protein [Cryptosporangium aurantiacum]|uniref:Monosaccharide ABC transporter substrate-binding protein, CUT2 family n=1 Tax=Cryptosporangium aurantiacum TaxID=134849 RepID=A0A1M7JWQ8_9ACTN|nr:substrate-binding domain-containing protein [Cryptosporangium aurantiacum]SHM56967.1 monosaccharide ABC transporter substrate-binding protein, CUT2 family [Cryptosporangium aurantiacum]
MRIRALGMVALGAVTALILAACGNDDSSDTADTGSSVKGKVGVILPDTQSSARWESFDKPLLTKAFEEAGVEADIQNALGDKSKFVSIADGMIQDGVSILAIVNLDSATGAQVEAKAKAAGVKTIDYDRLTLGGSADYYVSFDNVKVGELQGQGLVDCLTAAKKTNPSIIELNGSPTDNNATLFKQGYDSVLDPKYKEGWKKVGDQSVPDWDNAKAVTIFEQLLTAAGGNVDGVLAANDGLGNSAITVLKKNGLKVPVTGQDATVGGLQNILAGDQCMTVYKPIKQEAEGLVKLAVALLKGEKAETTGTVRDDQGKRDVPSLLLTPLPITKDSVKDVVADGFVTKAELCTGNYATLCTEAGVV